MEWLIITELIRSLNTSASIPVQRTAAGLGVSGNYIYSRAVGYPTGSFEFFVFNEHCTQDLEL